MKQAILLCSSGYYAKACLRWTNYAWFHENLGKI